jgi:tetratricopeptide (TPR) repeat protein
MHERRAESAHRKGLTAVARGDFLEALAYFEAALTLSGSQPGRLSIEAMSYYGLCLAMAAERLAEARDLCEAAVEAAPDSAELHLNLCRVCVAQGDRAHAFRILVRGLRVDPRHPGLVEAMRRLGFRRRPVVTFLPRQHPLNRLLGSLRSVLAERRGVRRRPVRAGRGSRAA